MKALWRFFASPGLTVALAALICLDAAWGSMVAVKNPAAYGALDRAVLFPWLFTTGLERPDLSAWIFVLVGLSALFAVNTAVCTADRLYAVVSNRRPLQALFPHVVHIGFLIALAGHLVGALWGFRSHGNLLIQGEAAAVPYVPELTVRLDGVDVETRPGEGLVSMKTKVTIFEKGREVLSDAIEINGPVIYKGVAFYHADHGSTPTGLVIEAGSRRREVSFGEVFTTASGSTYRLGRIYPDLAFDAEGRAYSRSGALRNPHCEIVSGSGVRAYLDISRPGTEVEVDGETLRLAGYVMTPYAVLTINRDPGMGLIVAGSAVLVAGMVLLLFMRGERGELVRGRTGATGPA